jgi:hypothetical protein
MSDESPLRPLIQKGTLVVYPRDTPGTPPARIIAFQFNPDTMKRTLAHRAPPAPQGGGTTGNAQEDVRRVGGPPVETISLTVTLHAADQLNEPGKNPGVAEFGLHPALATLELLMYPSTSDEQRRATQAQSGQVQTDPPDVPLVLFVWGKSRVVPVKITTFSVSEENFDRRLNPIYAKVELAMQVLTHVELQSSSLGRDAFMAYQLSKEALARAYAPSVNDPGIRQLLP